MPKPKHSNGFEPATRRRMQSACCTHDAQTGIEPTAPHGVPASVATAPVAGRRSTTIAQILLKSESEATIHLCTGYAEHTTSHAFPATKGIGRGTAGDAGRGREGTEKPVRWRGRPADAACERRRQPFRLHCRGTDGHFFPEWATFAH